MLTSNQCLSPYSIPIPIERPWYFVVSLSLWSVWAEHKTTHKQVTVIRCVWHIGSINELLELIDCCLGDRTVSFLLKLLPCLSVFQSVSYALRRWQCRCKCRCWSNWCVFANFLLLLLKLLKNCNATMRHPWALALVLCHTKKQLITRLSCDWIICCDF